ncbi:MAG: GDSL-type esterase/lipase family protein [Phycisphaerae bacterium]
MNAETRYYERLRAFEAEHVEPGGIVLVGSSHFEWFDADCFLPGRRIVNRGIASDRLGIGERGILHRLDISVFDVRPSFIVFNNGVNDLGELWRNGEPPLEAIFDAYKRVIAKIRAGLPDVPLLIVNELPTTGRFAGINPLVPQLNAYIAKVAERYGCQHLDFYSEVVNEAGELRSDLTTDGLHLNEAGYALLAERLTPCLPLA